MTWPASGIGAADATAAPPAVPGPTVTGNYLAAHHARAAGQETDAAAFLRAALAKSPDDPVLLGRTYVALTIDGRTAEAVEVARRFVAIEPNAALAHIVIAVGDIHGGRFEAAATRLRDHPAEPVLDLPGAGAPGLDRARPRPQGRGHGQPRAAEGERRRRRRCSTSTPPGSARRRATTRPPCAMPAPRSTPSPSRGCG